MARLIPCQHVIARPQATLYQLAVQPDVIEVTMEDKDRALAVAPVRQAMGYES